MIQSLCLLLLASPVSSVQVAGSDSLALTQASADALSIHVAQVPADAAEYERLKKEAGQDPTKLWKLYEWCKEHKKAKEGKAALKAILKVDPNHKQANIESGNLQFDDKWFPSQAKIDEYKKEKERQEKAAQGLVDFKGEWVAKEDLPYLEKGLIRDDAGNWVNGEEARKLKEGWVRQDLDWIPPAEKENIGKGLWKCGDKWLPLAEADEYHANMATWWRIPDARFTLLTTCDRDVALQKIKREVDAACDDLEKVYGTKLKTPVNVVVLRSQKQYSDYAAGDEDEQRQGTDAQGFSSIHYAYFGDAAFDAAGEFLGAGVAYWDASSADGNKWGVHAVRHAMGQSFGEAVDPSPRTLEKLRKAQKFDIKAFYAEKKIPSWFRYGAAAYAERYYNDTSVGIGGNPHWTKDWSIKEILKKGGLAQLKQIFEFPLSNKDQVESGKLINESGLLMAFILEGNCAPVTERLKAVQNTLRNEKSVTAAKPPETAEKSDKPAKSEKADKNENADKNDKGVKPADKGDKGAKRADKGDKSAKTDKAPVVDKPEKADKSDKDKKALHDAIEALMAEVIKNEAELRKFAGM